MATYLLQFEYADPERRLEVRPRHLDYLRGHTENGTVLLAGPCDDGGGRVLLDVVSVDEARRFMVEDPYYESGVVEEFSICAWTLAVAGPGYDTRSR